MSQSIFKTGNSLAVTIPVDFVKSLGIRPGDSVKVNAESDKGKITLYFSGAKQLLLSETFLKNKRKVNSDEKS